MKMKKSKNGLWKCTFNDLVFYTTTLNEAITIAWKVGVAR